MTWTPESSRNKSPRPHLLASLAEEWWSRRFWNLPSATTNSVKRSAVSVLLNCQFFLSPRHCSNFQIILFMCKMPCVRSCLHAFPQVHVLTGDLGKPAGLGDLAEHNSPKWNLRRGFEKFSQLYDAESKNRPFPGVVSKETKFKVSPQEYKCVHTLKQPSSS